MGLTVERLTQEQLCDLMCSGMDPEYDERGMNMDIFMSEDKRTYVAVDMKVKEEEAAKMANRHFRISRGRLGSGFGWVKGDTLYFEEKKGMKKVRLFWRKKADEL